MHTFLKSSPARGFSQVIDPKKYKNKILIKIDGKFRAKSQKTKLIIESNWSDPLNCYYNILEVIGKLIGQN